MKRYRLRSSYGLECRGRIRRRLLTLEEVNERVHRYYPNIDVLVYSGSLAPGVIYCHDCGETYTTPILLSNYMYYASSSCVKCKYIKRLEEYNRILSGTTLVADSFKYIDNVVNISAHCSVCGYTTNLKATNIYTVERCSQCAHNSVTEKYVEILDKSNCEYLDRYKVGKQVVLKYRCRICGTEDETWYSSLNTVKNLCSECNRDSAKNKFKRSKEDMINYGKFNGRYIMDYENTLSVKYRHLFCGGVSKTSKSQIKGIDLCWYCTYLRDCKNQKKNKETIDKTLTILKNVKKVKDILEETNQLDNFPEGEVKIILEHIDGWIKNFNTIVNKYPDKDIGSVLENNPLYERCKEIFYPVMDKFGIERIEGDDYTENEFSRY